MKKIALFASTLLCFTQGINAAIDQATLDKFSKLIDEENKLVLSVPGVQQTIDEMSSNEKKLKSLENTLGITKLQSQSEDLQAQLIALYEQIYELRKKSEIKEVQKKLSAGSRKAQQLLKPVQPQLQKFHQEKINIIKSLLNSPEDLKKLIDAEEQKDILVQNHIFIPFDEEFIEELFQEVLKTIKEGQIEQN